MIKVAVQETEIGLKSKTKTADHNLGGFCFVTKLLLNNQHTLHAHSAVGANGAVVLK